MEQLTIDLRGVAVYLDDILVSGNNAEEHVQNLRALFERFSEKGLRCKVEKCSFAQPSIENLGYVLSRHGVSKGSKVDAVIKMPPPTNVSRLRSFLGFMKVYAKFIQKPSTLGTGHLAARGHLTATAELAVPQITGSTPVYEA
uniref:Reverse transcriptase domain-containing protein n=1 Tax=Trichuris muris TaxID=70415 RepID=A0A5S6QB66_TRIMR